MSSQIAIKDQNKPNEIKNNELVLNEENLSLMKETYN